MKLLNIGMMFAFSLTLATGMGSKSKPAPVVEEPKVLPESTRVSAPAAVNTPVQLIENTAEENKKVDEALNTPTPDSTDKVKVKAPKKSKAAATKKKKAAAPKSKSKKVTKKKG